MWYLIVSIPDLCNLTYFKLHICLFGHTRDTSVIYEEAKFASFIYMQLEKVKFTSVQIKIKQVSCRKPLISKSYYASVRKDNQRALASKRLCTSR